MDTPAAPTPLSPPTVTGVPGDAGGDAGSGGVPLRRVGGDASSCRPVRRSDRGAAAGRAGLRRRDDVDRPGHPGPGDGADDRAAGRPAQLQVGPATFWWENPTGQPAYQQLRVGFGSGGPLSAAVTLADLPAPAPLTNVSGPQIAATAARRDGRAGRQRRSIRRRCRCRCSAPTATAVRPALPDSDPSYQRIYYREHAPTR